VTTWPLTFAAVERGTAPIYAPVGHTRMPRPLTLAEFQSFSFLDNQKQKSEVLARATSSEQPQRSGSQPTGRSANLFGWKRSLLSVILRKPEQSYVMITRYVTRVVFRCQEKLIVL